MRYAKALIAVCTAALLAAQTAFPMSTGTHGWVTVVLAGLGAFAVYQVPNAPMPAPTTEPWPPSPTGGVVPPRSFYEPPTIAPPVPGRYPPPAGGYTIMTPPPKEE